MFFDAKTGDVKICDNDNVSPDDFGHHSVYGTPKFMAPEIVRGEAKPSKNTDRFSLAVLLFYMLMLSHPLEGAQEVKIHCMDLQAMNKLYGENPVFIFDPNDTSNRPVKGFQDNAPIYWQLYPQYLRDLFTRAFTTGMKDPTKRITETEWMDAFANMISGIIQCKCKAEIFYDPDLAEQNKPVNCWGCSKQITLPMALKINKQSMALVMLQDIPGEYMEPTVETEELLACSGINKSTDLIMFIDSNHFVETRQKKTEMNIGEQYGEYCTQELNELFGNYEVLGRRLDVGALKSVQISISKLDLLVEADKRLEAAAFSCSGDPRHKDAISEARLNLVDRQIKALLGSKETGGYGYGDLIERIINPLKVSSASVRSAYTAVASKYIPGNDEHFDVSGQDVHYEYSMNVLEPLLNVFLSHNCLPSVPVAYRKVNN